MNKGNSEMFFSNKNFPILFRERKAWTARGLVKDIANILNDGLFLEYYKLYDKAPIRGKVDEIEIFRDDHNGAVDRDVGSIKLGLIYQSHIFLLTFPKQTLLYSHIQK